MGVFKKDKVEPKPIIQNSLSSKPPIPSKKNSSTISKELILKGDIMGQDDLIIEGTVEGKIEIKSQLTVQAGGVVKADIFAKKVNIAGKVYGNVQAEEVVELQPSAFLEGNIISPKITIQEGAHFKGNVDMKSSNIHKEPNL